MDPLRRRSVRLTGFDYSQRGCYFLTLCIQSRLPILGDIHDGEVLLNDCGRMVLRWWHELERKFPVIAVDQVIVMPNHLHGIVCIGRPGEPSRVGMAAQGAHAGAPLPGLDEGAPANSCRNAASPVGAALCGRPGDLSHVGMAAQDIPAVAPSLSTIVAWFKTMTTNAYIRGVNERGWQPFEKRFWQRNYYERVIRNERELVAIAQYIADNPRQWSSDPNHRSVQK